MNLYAKLIYVVFFFAFFFIMNLTALAEDDYLWTDYLAHNTTLSCQGPADPEPYKVIKYESPCKAKSTDPVTMKILKWACSAGFMMENGCMQAPSFKSRKIVTVGKSKEVIEYCVSAYIDWGQGSTCGLGTYEFEERVDGKDSIFGDITVVEGHVLANFCQNDIDGRYKHLCNNLKSKAKAYYQSLLLLVKGGKLDAGNQEESDNGDDEVKVTVSAYNSAYKPGVVIQDLSYFASQKGWKISEVREALIKGTVYDSNGVDVVPNADVEIKFREEKIDFKADKSGNFSRIITINPNGSKMLTANIDLYLTKKEQKMTVRVLSKGLVANGKTQRLLLQVIQEDGKPAANKSFLVNYEKDAFSHNGKSVEYLTRPVITNNLKTDSNGKGVLIIPAPAVIKGKLNNIPKPDKYFPVTAKLNLFKNEKVGEFEVVFESPFPEMEKVLLPGGMDAENWQETPSKIFIKDRDSNRFDIELRGYGKFKVRGGKIYSTLFHQYGYQGKVFEFYFASKELGLDLNKQPEVWKAFLETNMKVALSFLLALNEGTVFEKLRDIKSVKILNKKVPLNLTNKIDYDTTVGVTKLGFGGTDYYNNMLTYLDKKDRDYLDTMDMVVGGVFLTNDTISLITKTSLSLGATLQIELMKAIYENAKTARSIFNKYMKIVNSYRDIIFIPIYIKITDDDGYSTAIVKSIGVRLWKEAE